MSGIPSRAVRARPKSLLLAPSPLSAGEGRVGSGDLTDTSLRDHVQIDVPNVRHACTMFTSSTTLSLTDHYERVWYGPLARGREVDITSQF